VTVGVRQQREPGQREPGQSEPGQREPGQTSARPVPASPAHPQKQWQLEGQLDWRPPRPMLGGTLRHNVAVSAKIPRFARAGDEGFHPAHELASGSGCPARAAPARGPTEACKTTSAGAGNGFRRRSPVKLA